MPPAAYLRDPNVTRAVSHLPMAPSKNGGGGIGPVKAAGSVCSPACPAAGACGQPSRRRGMRPRGQRCVQRIQIQRPDVAQAAAAGRGAGCAGKGESNKGKGSATPLLRGRRRSEEIAQVIVVAKSGCGSAAATGSGCAGAGADAAANAPTPPRPAALGREAAPQPCRAGHSWKSARHA